jgi:predicted metalloprotease
MNMLSSRIVFASISNEQNQKLSMQGMDVVQLKHEIEHLRSSETALKA